jgi:hypothetical protein
MPDPAMRKKAALVTAIFMLMCLLWSLMIPIGESHDENNHVRYAQFIWERHRLPVGHEIWSGEVTEGFQPPLYHTILAGLVGLLNFRWEEINWVLNPRFETASTGEPNVLDNRAVRDTSPASAVARYHVLRLPSILISGLTFWWLWLGLAKLFNSGQLALTAVSIWGFMVQTTHMGGVVGNDMLTAAICSLAFVQLVTARGTSGLARYALVGVLLGLAMTSKMTGLFVYGGVVMGLLFDGLWRRRPAALAVVIILPVAIGGWAVWRSTQVHIPPLEKAWMVTLADGLLPYLKSWLIATLHAVQSGTFLFIGQPGWGWLPMPGWYFGLYLAGAITVVGLCVERIRTRFGWPPAAVLGYVIGWAVFSFMTIYWFRESTERLAGRFFYPFMAGPLGIVCWAAVGRTQVARVRTSLAVALTGLGVALLGIRFFGLAFLGRLGSGFKGLAPFAQHATHYSNLIALDVMTVAAACCFLGVAAFTFHRWMPRVAQAYPVVIAGSVALNTALLFGHVLPRFS